MITDFIKPKPKTSNVRINDLTRHLSLLGTCLFMMVCPEYQHDEEDAEAALKAAGKGKKKKVQ